MMRRYGVVGLAILLALTAGSFAKKKKKQEEQTQTLQLPRELPQTVVAETRRLAFYVSPLSSKGLLSQQVRDALRAISRSSRGAVVVKLRAFVAGSGDLRRARDLVSEYYTERRQPLPALSLVQVGALPREGAQVVLEAVAVGKKEVNPAGLAFLSGQVAASPSPLDPAPPLAEKSLASLRAAVAAVGAGPQDVLRVTCFLSSLEKWLEVRVKLASAYPKAAQNVVQAQRAPSQAICECEAVARLAQPPAGAVEMRNPADLPRANQGYSQLALVGAPRLIFSGTQASFGFQDGDARLAFERLQKAVEQAGGSLKQAVFSGFYPLSLSIAGQIRKVRGEFYNQEQPPAATMLLFEGLPSMDAGFAVDVIAVKP